MEGLLLHIERERRTFFIVVCLMVTSFQKREGDDDECESRGKIAPVRDVIVTAVETLFSFNVYYFLPFSLFFSRPHVFFLSTRGTRPDALRVGAVRILIPLRAGNHQVI